VASGILNRQREAGELAKSHTNWKVMRREMERNQNKLISLKVVFTVDLNREFIINTYIHINNINYKVWKSIIKKINSFSRLINSDGKTSRNKNEVSEHV
jgi:hypothetical protein